MSPAVPVAAAIPRPAQTFFGLVVGAKQMQKTIKVRVGRTKMHPVVLKPVTKHKTFLVHDPVESCVVGDWVQIDSCRKLSKHKNFKLAKIVHPAARFFEEDTGVMHSQASVDVSRMFKKDEYKQPSILEQLEMEEHKKK
ncbi:hypothetical protein HDU83_005698 [Entophlyctis luteolus]|nr:hypothetical protein HDU83_005698 [Entophlyctis luteolus]